MTEQKDKPQKKTASSKTANRAEVRRQAKITKPDGYCFAIGRRKRAVAQTKVWTNTKQQEITVNGQEFKSYFPLFELQETVLAPLRAVGLESTSKIELKVAGGGMRGQAEAARMGIARALLVLNPDYRSSLKAQGYLTRDPREKERRKYGLKKARRAPQWSKR